MRRGFKVIIVLVLVVVIAGIGAFAYTQQTGHSIAGNVVKRMLGSEEAADLTDRIVTGDEVTDSDLIEATGIDEETFYTIKSVAAEHGIDVNDSKQLADILSDNADELPEVRDIARRAQIGAISTAEALSELGSILELPGE